MKKNFAELLVIPQARSQNDVVVHTSEMATGTTGKNMIVSGRSCKLKNERASGNSEYMHQGGFFLLLICTR